MIDHRTEQQNHPNRIEWNGTHEEALSLLHALKAHCECIVEQGRTTKPCPGHDMLTHDQRALDGLLFERRIVSKLRAEEFDLSPKRLEIAISD